MSDFLKVYGPITLLVALSFWVAYQFVDPAPPRSLTLATGSPEGAYHAFGERYKALLAKDGIEVLAPARNHRCGGLGVGDGREEENDERGGDAIHGDTLYGGGARRGSVGVGLL